MREIQEPFLERFLYLTKQKLHLLGTSMLQYLVVCYQRNLMMSMAGQFFILQTKPEKRSPMPICRENTNSRSELKSCPQTIQQCNARKKHGGICENGPRNLTGTVTCQTDLSLNALPPTCKTGGELLAVVHLILPTNAVELLGSLPGIARWRDQPGQRSRLRISVSSSTYSFKMAGYCADKT